MNNTKLQREDDQLRKRVEELQEQIVKLRDDKLQNDNAELKKENIKLRKDIEKLRHVDRRQRDQIDGLELEAKVKDLIRQEDDVLERKKRQSQSSNSSQEEAMSEVEITGGSAKATSVLSESYKPENAFIRGNPRPWESGGDKKNDDIFPQMVWYDFGHGNAFVPARVSFRGRPDCSSSENLSCRQRTPSIWEFVGSNDDTCAGSGNWTVLCQDLSDVMPQKVGETKFCDVHSNNPREYRCLGINVIRVHDVYTTLSNVRMWKNVIQMEGGKNATRLE